MDDSHFPLFGLLSSMYCFVALGSNFPSRGTHFPPPMACPKNYPPRPFPLFQPGSTPAFPLFGLELPPSPGSPFCPLETGSHLRGFIGAKPKTPLSKHFPRGMRPIMPPTGAPIIGLGLGRISLFRIFSGVIFTTMSFLGHRGKAFGANAPKS